MGIFSQGHAWMYVLDIKDLQILKSIYLLYFEKEKVVSRISPEQEEVLWKVLSKGKFPVTISTGWSKGHLPSHSLTASSSLPGTAAIRLWKIHTPSLRSPPGIFFSFHSLWLLVSRISPEQEEVLWKAGVDLSVCWKRILVQTAFGIYEGGARPQMWVLFKIQQINTFQYLQIFDIHPMFFIEPPAQWGCLGIELIVEVLLSL